LLSLLRLELARTNGINAFATHKREEVSVEELRAMQYMHGSHSS
jgi:hypothetical protein